MIIILSQKKLILYGGQNLEKVYGELQKLFNSLTFVINAIAQMFN